MDRNQIWTPHLQPGEHIVWSAGFSESIRRAERARIQRSTAFLAVVSALLAILAGYRFYETLSHGQPGLASGVAAPLFFVFGLALSTFSFFMFRRLNLPAPDADHYAITDRRLLALDRSGALVDEISGKDVADVIFDNDRRPSEIHVSRRGDDQRMFFIEHLPDLPAVKARIQQQFPAPEETT